MKQIIVATKNMNKMREIREILGSDELTFISQDEAGIHIDIEETGSTFEENSLLKARGIAKLAGVSVMADDSGLCIDALDGRPGIYSARYAGEGATNEQKIAKVLDEMKGVTNRKAHFVSVAVLVSPDGTELISRGEVDGEILDAPDGNGGFGYDPIFYCTELGKSFGKATEEEKNSVSHRHRALVGLSHKMQATSYKK